MKFDSKKWNAYVQEQGAENLAKKLIKNPLGFYYCSVIDKDVLLQSSINELEDPRFNPFIDKSFSIIFLLLGLDINDFILPEPVKIVTGIEALRALCDGKILRHLKSDVFYKIENNIFLLKSVSNNRWEKSYTYIDYILIDEFEVCVDGI